MKIQRKMLTSEQKNKICRERKAIVGCVGCRLSDHICVQGRYIDICVRIVDSIEEQLQDFWNKEVEIDDEIFGDNSGT